MRRVISLWFSDSHGGSKFGLMNPDVELYDEGPKGQLIEYTPEPTASQEYMWEVYQEGLGMIKSLAGPDEIIATHNGDECHGNKHPDGLVSTRLADQFFIAEANMLPVLDMPNVEKLRMGIGTAAHDFKEGTSTIVVSGMLKRRFPKKSIEATYHGLMSINGMTIDYAHHGPFTGSRTWLKGNVARYYLQSMMLQEIVAKREPPKLVIRSHYHEPICERVAIGGYESYIIITPALCMIDEFSQMATKSQYQVTNGLIGLEIVDGKLLDMHSFYKTTDIRRFEEL